MHRYNLGEVYIVANEKKAIIISTYIYEVLSKSNYNYDISPKGGGGEDKN